ncbi:hypothetical protein Hdeb2414_s0006g00210381 [Helianthus debilis subsp. tardiflorus]
MLGLYIVICYWAVCMLLHLVGPTNWLLQVYWARGFKCNIRDFMCDGCKSSRVLMYHFIVPAI